MSNTIEYEGTIDSFSVSVVLVDLTLTRHRCGYVVLPEGHPWLELGYDVSADVHGGITYNEGNKIGFDCAHWGDDETRCDVEFVKSELVDLVRQAKEAYNPG